MKVAIRKLSEKNRTLMIYMFNTAYCIMKEELPYTLLFYSILIIEIIIPCVISYTGFDINFLTNLSIRASANLFYLPETVNY
jgi:hypothetical protein